MNTNTNNTESIKYYRIGTIAKQLDVSARTIRYYEELGLISTRRSDGGYREYSEIELDKLKTIIKLKELGLTLEEIKDLSEIKNYSTSDKSVKDLMSLLKMRMDQFQKKINEYQSAVNEFRALINIIETCPSFVEKSEIVKCKKCLEKQNKTMPSLMKVVL